MARSSSLQPGPDPQRRRTTIRLATRFPLSSTARTRAAGALVLLLLAAPAVAQAGPASPRQRFLMDYGWTFLLGDPAGAERPEFDDAAWRRLDLPHDWSIELPVQQDAPSGGSGGYAQTGVGWYRRTFQAPGAAAAGSGSGAAERRVRIDFEGVYQNSDVWINGHHLGHRPYGYIGFGYDLTPYLGPGENVVAVRVDNSRQPNSRWYTGSGIYRHVWLTVTGPLHVARWGTYITTPDVDSAAARVRVRTSLRNEGPGARRGIVRLAVLDSGGREVARAEAPFQVDAGATSQLEQDVRVDAPRLWSTDTPTLYTLRTTVSPEYGPVADVTEEPFGIRRIAFDPDRGFLLNGQRVKLRGVNLHQDGGPVGAAVPEAVWARRFRLLQAMGVNAIRTAHNPPSPEFMELADRMGLLIMDEAFDEWTIGKREFGYHLYFDDWGERDLADFIRRDRNHPSVVIWSLGNEIGEQFSPGGDSVLRALKAVSRREDPSRLVTTGNDHIAADNGATTDAFLSLLDVVGYNYVDRWHERRELYNTADRHAHPDWKFIGTEDAAVRGRRGAYSLGNDSARVEADYPTSMIRAEQLWKWVALHDFFAGDFMWTGIDYLGETFWPGRGAPSGQLDLVGFPDDGYYFYQSVWTAAPMLRLFPHWNWPGREGQVIPVLAYTNVDAVDLYLNGRFIGEKRREFPRQGTSGDWNHYDRPQVHPTTADLHLAWDVPYEPGVLRAVGKRDGQVVVTEEVRTAGAPAALRLSVDRDRIRAGERDIAHVRIEVVDSAGTVVPDADTRVEVAVEGAADLLTLGNGNLTDHSPYFTSSRRAYSGLLLAMVQSGDATGEVRVSARADGLEPASLTLRVVPGHPAPRLATIPPAR